MGWDVVQIGLKHDLPVDGPIATAELVAKRMNRNIKLVYRHEYEYDKTSNIVSEVKRRRFVQIAKFTIDSSKDYLRIIAPYYQLNKILKKTDIKTLRKAKFTSDWAKLLLRMDIKGGSKLYSIEDKEFRIDIYRENVELDVKMDVRWWGWEKLFHSQSFDRDILLDYRMKFFEQARICGCKELIICADQGPTELILDKINYTTKYFKRYVSSNQYYKNIIWHEAEEKESWKKHAKKINFSSVFQDDFKLEGEDFVELVYDDFKDLI